MSNYEDIIHLPYPRKPQRMSNYDRAAQFSPFAALTGHEEAVAETARLTESAIELGEDGAAMLDEKLRRLEPGQEITVVYFRPDSRKSGGAYVRRTGIFKRLEPHRNALTFMDGTQIPLKSVCDLSHRSQE